LRWRVVTAAVEGSIDEAVARRLAAELGITVDRVFGKAGKSKLILSLHGYNRAAARSPWWVLMDLDQDADCAPAYVAELLPRPSRHMKLRIVVRAVEAWLLADRSGFARHLRIRKGALPTDPEELPDPKQFVVDVAQSSTSRTIREALVPRAGSGRKVGPGYGASMIEFAERHWDPRTALSVSETLQRCCNSLPRDT
jgi:hypothetical protein